MPTRDPDFPNPGTDRRPDELERNLRTEEEAEFSRQRAVETDRIADEDREAGDVRASALEEVVENQRHMINALGFAVVALSLAMVVVVVIFGLA